MSLITGLIAKNSHNVCGVYIITEFTLKGFEYQIQISVKRLGKKLSRKTSFSTFSQISDPHFKLNLVKSLAATKVVKLINFEEARDKLQVKICF